MVEALRPYPSPQQREAAVDDAVAAAGGEVVEYGHSVQGRPLRAIRLAGPPGAPKILCSANIHGPEYVAGAVALGLAQRADDPTVANLRSRAELWVIPCLNPDGYAFTWRCDGNESLGAMRTNARGVDLNRNFPLPHAARRRALPGAGSSVPGHATYHGPSALSEPETAALHELCADQRFHASANLHSFMGTLIPARVTDRADYRAYRGLCRRFAAGQPRWHYRRLASRVFDVFTGEQEDHQHHALGTWAVCVEVFTIGASVWQHLRAPNVFWRFNPRDPGPWVDNDVPGVVAFFEAALDRPPPR